MKWFSVQRKGRLAVASWHGEIGFGAGGQDFIDAMGDAEEVQLVIDSGGGSTTAALLAAPQLAGRQTTVHVPRLCGSAATLGGVASRRVCCGPDARFLIHGVVDACMGNAAAHGQTLRAVTSPG